MTGSEIHAASVSPLSRTARWFDRPSRRSFMRLGLGRVRFGLSLPGILRLRAARVRLESIERKEIGASWSGSRAAARTSIPTIRNRTRRVNIAVHFRNDRHQRFPACRFHRTVASPSAGSLTSSPWCGRCGNGAVRGIRQARCSMFSGDSRILATSPSRRLPDWMSVTSTTSAPRKPDRGPIRCLAYVGVNAADRLQRSSLPRAIRIRRSRSVAIPTSPKFVVPEHRTVRSRRNSNAWIVGQSLCANSSTHCNAPSTSAGENWKHSIEFEAQAHDAAYQPAKRSRRLI